MKIYVSKHDLNSRLRTIGKIIKRNAVTAELESFKFQVGANGIILTGADTEGQISSFLPCRVDSFESSIFLVNAKTILDALKELPEQPLVIDANKSDDNTSLKLHYHNGAFEFVGMKADLFPQIREVDDPTTINLKASLLTQAFRTVSKFSGTDDLRPILTGVSISSKNSHVSFAGTNGSKMALYEDEVDNEINDFEIVISNKCISILSGLLVDSVDDVNFKIGLNNFQVLAGDYKISYRLTDGKYPNYRSVIPTRFNQRVIVDRNEVIAALKRVSVFSDDTTKTIIMRICSSSMAISSEDIDFRRSAIETINIENDGDDIDIGFNSNFILEVFSTIEEDKAEMNIINSEKAVVVNPLEDKKTTMLLMPIMINK